MEDVTFRFTPEQAACWIRVTGISLQQITVTRLFLKLAAAVALQTQSVALLISDSPAALQAMRTGGLAAVESDYFLFSMELDSAQQQLLREITGRNFERVAMIPDDYKVSYAENWDEIPLPIDVGQSLTIASSACDLSQLPSQRKLILLAAHDFGGFGTGTHPTTRMCLELIEETLRAGQRVLEIGTGSGILAIACARLAATSVAASDVDPAAVLAARENVKINGLQSIVRVSAGTFGDQSAPDETQSYDLIVGNLFPAVLKPLFPELRRRLKPAGHLIISGIVSERERDVARAWQQAGFGLKQRREREDWLALVLECDG